MTFALAGIAAVGVYNSYFSGRNAYYLERIVNAGFVGLHTASGSPHIVPPGATRPALGTNPIAFGFLSADGPVIFDIGTASLMWGEVLLAAETREALPPGVAFDADGSPTLGGRVAASPRRSLPNPRVTPPPLVPARYRQLIRHSPDSRCFEARVAPSGRPRNG
jgi:LDH2 family malate/lactate/ureidoglycolate dehydrogenase